MVTNQYKQEDLLKRVIAVVMFALLVCMPTFSQMNNFESGIDVEYLTTVDLVGPALYEFNFQYFATVELAVYTGETPEPLFNTSGYAEIAILQQWSKNVNTIETATTPNDFVALSGVFNMDYRESTDAGVRLKYPMFQFVCVRYI